MLPEDLIKFGLIPEFIGRLPVVGAVSSLDKEALIRILVEPKNALVKQYQRVFELDGVELELGDDALEAVAEQALLRGTGARGLRAILEEVLLEVMYDLPSRTDIGQVRDRPGRRARPGPPHARTAERAGQSGPHAPGCFLTRRVWRWPAVVPTRSATDAPSGRGPGLARRATPTTKRPCPPGWRRPRSTASPSCAGSSAIPNAPARSCTSPAPTARGRRLGS